MKKVILQYDDVTSQVFDMNGAMICTWVGLDYDEVGAQGDQAEVSVDTDSTPVKLAKQGMSADELVKLREAGVI